MEKIKGEIILIDKQKYEKELLNVTLDRLHYEIHIKYLNNAPDALEYLVNTEEKIFLIISNFHITKDRGGLELVESINNNPILKIKSIPFIFTCDNPTREEINEAYKYCIQGFFTKPDNMASMCKEFEMVINYWLLSKHPNELNLAVHAA